MSNKQLIKFASTVIISLVGMSQAIKPSRLTMQFDNAHANSSENLWLPRTHGKGMPVVEYLKLDGVKSEGITFIHEWNGYFCFYSQGSVHLCKGTSLSPSKVIEDLPGGRSIVFEPKKIYFTLNSGPTLIWDEKFKTLAEGTTIPYSGGFADVIGFYSSENQLHIVNSLSSPGGNALFTKTLIQSDASKPARIALLANVDSAGLFYQSLRFGNIQILTSDRGFHFAKWDGTVLSSHFQESPVRFGAVSPDSRVLGAFGSYQGKWSYLEFDKTGKLGFHLALKGSEGYGRVAFDDGGNRYITGRKELVKIGPQWNTIWTKALKGSNSNPNCLVIAEGGCAFVDGLNFIVLNPDGTESFSVPVRGKKITSPPYLSEAGQFYIGLSNDIDDFLRISFKPSKG